MQVEDRIAALEERTRALEARIGLAAPSPLGSAPSPLGSAPPPLVSAPPPARSAPAGPRANVSAPSKPVAFSAPPRQLSGELEDLVGGRVLAWVGGLAVALGVIFLLAIAVSRGWIGEVERTLLAGVLSGGLLATGVRLHGRRGRTDAARAASAAGIVGLFATALVAGSVYHLVPALLAIVAAVAVGAIATALAIRWAAPGIAALGILGALASPVVLDGMQSSASVVMLFIATASATAVVTWQRWTWLGFATYAIATPQWLLFLWRVDGDAVVLPVLVVFGALTAAAAVGFEVRSRAGTIGVWSILLLALNALVLGLVGVDRLDHADLWLVFLALAHIAVGAGGRRTTRISPDLAMAGLALGIVLADVASARILDGLPLVLSWSAGGALFAGLTRLAAPGLDRHAALAGLGGHIALALTSAVLVAPAGSVTGQIGLMAVAATSLISGRLAEAGRTELRMVLDAIALALVAYVTVTGLDDLRLTLALAAETFGLIMIARRHSEDAIAVSGAVAFAALTALHALSVLAPPDALVHGLAHPLPAAAGLGAATLAVALLGLIDRRWAAVAPLLVLYAASVELVTAFAGTPQLAQALLSALWAATGVGVLIAGLVRDGALLRHAALALLAVTAGKVFLYDLASLDSLSRVASFIVLGLLLLAGAFAWQRIRPQPLPDLRKMPGSLR